MKKFFKENKIFLAIIIGALIIGGVIIISNQGKRVGDGNEVENRECVGIPELPDGASKLATKIIDGDTLVIEGGYSVRILGIDADERNYPCYEPAKNRLEELILGREVKLEKGKEDKDQWCRYLRYVFLDEKNISLELVRQGLVATRFSPEDIKYREEIVQAEETAKENKIGCKWGEREMEEERKVDFQQWEKLTSELTGLKVVGACRAGVYLGEEIIIEGKVVDTYRYLRSNTVFLNFEKAFPNQCFTGVIFSSVLYKFVQSPEDYYQNKTIRIRGKVEEHEGRPQIILQDTFQIEVGE